MPYMHLQLNEINKCIQKTVISFILHFSISCFTLRSRFFFRCVHHYSPFHHVFIVRELLYLCVYAFIVFSTFSSFSMIFFSHFILFSLFFHPKYKHNSVYAQRRGKKQRKEIANIHEIHFSIIIIQIIRIIIRVITIILRIMLGI